MQRLAADRGLLAEIYMHYDLRFNHAIRFKNYSKFVPMRKTPDIFSLLIAYQSTAKVGKFIEKGK